MELTPLARLAAAGTLVAVTAAFTSQLLPDAVAAPTAMYVVQDLSIPASDAAAAGRLAKSSRHGEYVMIPAGNGDSLRAYVVYPERKDKAPVVVVIEDIYGFGSWIKGVGDQLAADGFIAVVPDLLTGAGVADGDSAVRAASPGLIRTLKREDVQRRIAAAGTYGMSLPAAVKKYGVVGYCWGGSTVFTHAVDAAKVGAVVVYYGGPPAAAELSKINAPILAHYGGNDARINASIPATDSVMKSLKKRYDYTIYDGAGHGFLRQQEGSPANLEATKKAWPKTIAFFRETLGK